MKNIKFLSLMLAIIMCLTSLTPAYAAEGAEYENVDCEEVVPTPTPTPTPTPIPTPTPTPEPVEESTPAPAEESAPVAEEPEEVEAAVETAAVEEAFEPEVIEDPAEENEETAEESEVTENEAEEPEKENEAIETVEEALEEEYAEETEEAESVVENEAADEDEEPEAEEDPEDEEPAEESEIAAEEAQEAPEEETEERAEDLEVIEAESEGETEEAEITEDAENVSEEDTEELNEEVTEESAEEPAEPTLEEKLEAADITLIDLTSGEADYSVEFYLGDKCVSVDGGKGIEFSQIADALGIEGKIVGFESGAKDFFDIQDGEFNSYNAFGSTYELLVTLENGETIVLNVSDGSENGAKIGSTEYKSLVDAISAVNDNETIVLLKSHSGTGFTIDSSKKNVTVDLGGFTYTVNNGPQEKIVVNGSDASLKIVNSAKDKGTITSETKGKNVAVTATNGAVLTLGTGTVLNGNIVVNNNSTANISGKVYAKEWSVQSAADGTDTHINVYKGADIESQNNIGIVVRSGSLYIEDGRVEGRSAVYFEGENLAIDGGSLVANGEKQKYSPTSIEATGEALIIDSKNYDKNTNVIKVTGGHFLSKNTRPVGSYASKGGKPDYGNEVKEFIRGGYYSSAVKGSYLVSGYGNYWNVNDDYEKYPIVVAKSQPYGYCWWQTAIMDAYFRFNGKSVPTTVKIENGKASATDLDLAALKKMIDRSEGNLIFDISRAGYDIESVEFTSSVLTIAAAAAVEKFTVALPGGSIELDAEALKSVAEQMQGTTVRYYVGTADNSGLNQNQFSAVAKMNNVAEVADAYISSGTKRITSLGEEGHARITLARRTIKWHQADSIAINILRTDGTAEAVPFIKPDYQLATAIGFREPFVTYYGAVEYEETGLLPCAVTLK